MLSSILLNNYLCNKRYEVIKIYESSFKVKRGNLKKIVAPVRKFFLRLRGYYLERLTRLFHIFRRTWSRESGRLPEIKHLALNYMRPYKALKKFQNHTTLIFLRFWVKLSPFVFYLVLHLIHLYKGKTLEKWLSLHSVLSLSTRSSIWIFSFNGFSTPAFFLREKRERKKKNFFHFLFRISFFLYFLYIFRVVRIISWWISSQVSTEYLRVLESDRFPSDLFLHNHRLWGIRGESL